MLANLGIDNPLMKPGRSLGKGMARRHFFCVKDKSLLGILAVADVIKPSSREAVASLKNWGWKLCFNLATMPRLQKSTRQAGIERVVAEVCPGQRKEVRRLQNVAAR